MSDLVTRFAPSPTGRLHLGHAYSALFAQAAARAGGGEFLIRVEDIDTTRCREEFVEGILEDLCWLGVESDREVLRQSGRLEFYREALWRLRASGFLYPCFCTRKQIESEIAAAGDAPHGPAGALYPGTCRQLGRGQGERRIAAGEAHAWRLDTARAASDIGELEWSDRGRGVQRAEPHLLGDVVLARKDIATSYHLAVTVDDAAQGVSLVTRGEDLAESTHIHRLLQALLGLPVPEWHHHELLCGEDGRRFAKRDRSLTLRSIREGGKAPHELRRELGFPP